MPKQYCAFCSKKIGLFCSKSKEAEQDGICLCRKCYSSFWRKQLDSKEQAKQLAKFALSGSLNSKEKKVIVRHIKELLQHEESASVFNDVPHDDKTFSPSNLSETKTPGFELQEAPALNPIVTDKLEGTSFLCGTTFRIGGLEINNPCIYISDEGFSFGINSKAIPMTIVRSDRTDTVAEQSLEQKDLFFFDQIELSYFLLWLSNHKDYECFPPHCFSRFYDGVFHRTLVEHKDQLQIINKIIDIVSVNQSMELNVRLLRFVFSVLIDCGNKISYEDKTDICKKLENLFTFNFYYLKSGWDWDPVSWYLDFGMENYIPKSLLTYQKMASAEIKASKRGIILAKAFTKCESMLKGKDIKSGSLILLNSYTERFVKNYHNEVFTYKTRNWTISGIDDETEDQTLFNNMDEYIYSDWHHAELVNPDGENALIELWLAMPPEYQRQISGLFRLEITPYIDKEITVRTLFSIFKKTYPETTKNIWAIGDYYLRYIQRCVGYLGYSLVLSIPIENVKLETHLWIVDSTQKEQKQKELVDKSEEPMFTVNEKGRVVGISPKVYELETVHIPSEIGAVRVKEIGPEVFANAKNIKHIIIDEGVKAIRQLAFNHCEKLELIDLPESLTEIAHGSFFGCQSLKQFRFPRNVKKIGSSIFTECTSLERVEFNEIAVSVGYQMFCDCSSLKEVFFPPLMESIPSMFFYNCKSLESITIPNKIDRIEASAFANCNKLKTVIFENDRCKIENSVFSDCISLTSISLPKSIEEVEDYTFQNCVGLKTIEIPAGVKHIGGFAFGSCEDLESVVFHNEECVFDDFVFAGCVSLKTIMLPRKSQGELSSIFQRCRNLEKIVAPRTMVKGDGFSYLVNSYVEIQFYD